MTRRRLATLVVVLLMVVGLVVIADRVAAYAASRTVADQVRRQLVAQQITPTHPLDVHVHGFPFLTQVAAGHYDKVTIDTAGVTAQGVALSDIHIAATGVRAQAGQLVRGTGPIIADKVTGTGRLPWSQVPALLQRAGVTGAGDTVTGSDDGQVTMRVPVAIGATSITLVATGTIEVHGGKLAVKVAHLDTEGGGLPAQLVQLIQPYAEKLSGTFSLPELPYRLTVNEATVSAAGLTVHAAGAKVLITSGSSTG